MWPTDILASSWSYAQSSFTVSFDKSCTMKGYYVPNWRIPKIMQAFSKPTFPVSEVWMLPGAAPGEAMSLLLWDSRVNWNVLIYSNCSVIGRGNGKALLQCSARDYQPLPKHVYDKETVTTWQVFLTSTGVVASANLGRRVHTHKSTHTHRAWVFGWVREHC